MVRYFHIDVLMVDERFSLMVACGCEEKTVCLSIGVLDSDREAFMKRGIFSTLRTKNSLLREASQVSISGLYLSTFFRDVCKVVDLFCLKGIC